MTVCIPLSGERGAGRFAVVDDEDLSKVDERRWYLHEHGYAVNGGLYMHRVILGIDGAGHRVLADHRNHDRLDNRRENLRVANGVQNIANRREPQVGVYLSRSGRWVVHIAGVRGGTYATRDEALVVRNAEHERLRGEFATRVAVPTNIVPVALTRAAPRELSRCEDCGAKLSRKALTPSAVRLRKGKPMRCWDCHRATLNAIRWASA